MSRPRPSTRDGSRGLRKQDGPFAAAAVGLLLVAVIFGAVASSYRAANEWVHHTVVVHHAAERWLAAVLDAESRMRGYVVSGQQDFLDSHAAALRVERERATRLRELVVNDPIQTKNVDAAERDVLELLERQRELVALVHAGHRDEAIERFSAADSHRDLELVRDDIRRIRDDEAITLTERRSGVDTRATLLLAVAFVVVFASFGALAWAWRTRRSREAMLDRAAGEARARLDALSELAVALADATARDQVASAVVGQGMRAAQSDTCTLYLLDESGTVLRLIGTHGIASELSAQIERITEAANPEAFRRFHARATTYVENDDDYRALFPALANAKAAGPRAHAFWSVPLVAEGRPVGLLGMGYYAPRRFTVEERGFIETLGHQCAQALLRADRLEREREDRIRRDFLARVGGVLVSSPDHREILNELVRVAVPVLGDWCSVELREASGPALRGATIAHGDPRTFSLAQGLVERRGQELGARRGAENVFRTGSPELHAEAGVGTVMIVPLRGRSRMLGTMTFVRSDLARGYGAADVEFAEDVAHRAGMALENALALREVELARAEERALRNAAEIASRAKDEFLAVVSHELRTPLTAILGWAVTLRELGGRADVERGLAVIERNARSQTKLIEDVLDVSRIISGKLALSPSPTNVAEVVTTAIETVQHAASAKTVTIQSELPEPSPSIHADPGRLQQIVWNLLSNAVKFTPSGGRVTVQVSVEAGEVCIRVTDTGEGIPEDLLPFVFEPFRQADASTTRRHGGLGLGLAIVKHLVQAHGGTVHADSAGAGEGAAFTVRLPAGTRPPAVRAPDPVVPSAAPRSAPPRLDGVTVLVVDDEQDARELVRDVLVRAGAQVETASSARGARESVLEASPDVLVSDIGMPDEDGYSLIRSIRARGALVPAVALTAYARPEDAARAHDAGFVRHLAKPIEPSELVLAVASLVRARVAT
ncbi:MAG TPA: ATP-binding protein [Polyangiaceae bacterium]|nr:ATP-binding protein [Polyangiaceae bacterium]